MAGQNLVTPDDLGKRVSFQFELPNGFVGEAVGVFERWDEDAETYFVRKKDGSEVRVPARGVRFGKVVAAPPPRLGRLREAAEHVDQLLDVERLGDERVGAEVGGLRLVVRAR